MNHPDAVPRRPAIELTEELKMDLEDQGIAREEQCDDLTVMKARYRLEKKVTIAGMEQSKVGEMLSKECVLKKVAILMKECDDTGRGMLCFIVSIK